MRVLVLGCGPAGLIAAHAARLQDASVAILSKPRKSFMNGAQYLHVPIPELNCGDPFDIRYRLIGSAEGYRFKVYGPKWDGTVSPEDLEEDHQGWDIRKAYDSLWTKYSHLITPWEASPAGLKNAIRMYTPDLVVSTVPAPLLCAAGHNFRATRIYSTDRDITGILKPGEVLLEGTGNARWYRTSNIQGYCNTEWPDGVKPPITPMWEVSKPLDNDCVCFPEVVRAGRYGKWTKGVLSHEVFKEVTDKCRTSQAPLW